MRIREIMSSPAVVVGPGASVKEAATLLDERGFTCLPVVSADGRLLGVVSEAELLAGRFPPDPRLPISERIGERVGATVGDVMVRDVLVAHPEEGVADLLTILRSTDVRSMPVVDDDVVVGVVTYRDLMHALARDDALIRADVQRRLDLYGRVGRWRVSVRDGEVTIADRGGDIVDRSGAVRVAESVIGVTTCRVVDAVSSAVTQANRTGWSVCGVGEAYEIGDPARLRRLEDRWFEPWPDRSAVTVSIPLQALSGRRRSRDVSAGSR